MLVPPSEQPIMIGPADERSSSMAKYISRASFILRATYRVLTGLPASNPAVATSD